MTILFAGGELDAFVQPSGNAGVSTSATWFDADFCRCAMYGNDTRPLVAPFATQSEIWCHATVWKGNSNASVVLFQARNSSGQAVVRIMSIGGNPDVISFQYWNGASWVVMGTNPWASASSITLDIHVKVADIGGIFEMYVSGILVASFTGDTNLFVGSAIDDVWFGGTWSGSQTVLSCGWTQIIVTDTVDTRAMKLSTLVPNANGVTASWTGSFLDVDEVGNYSDTDFISSGTPDQVELFGLSDMSAAAATLDVLAFIMTGRARKGVSGPQNIQATLNTGGADYFSGNLPGLSGAFNSLPVTIWEVNPGTALAWSVADINALQAGFKSIA